MIQNLANQRLIKHHLTYGFQPCQDNKSLGGLIAFALFILPEQNNTHATISNLFESKKRNG
jgi:hypothetical protein